jgi:hypothetical protein
VKTKTILKIVKIFDVEIDRINYNYRSKTPKNCRKNGRNNSTVKTVEKSVEKTSTELLTVQTKNPRNTVKTTVRKKQLINTVKTVGWTVENIA